MKALIIDDEELARTRILGLLKQTPEVEVLGECHNGKSAVSKINELQPDLIFLDINMKDMNGFEVLQRISVTPKPIVVFVTAYDSFALKAFDVNAFDFLLKPFKDERFFRAIEKIKKISRTDADQQFEEKLINLFNLHKEKEREQDITYKLPIRQGNKTILLNPDDILYIKASGSYIEIYSTLGKHVLRESLKELCKNLNNQRFLRIHRSTVINLNQVKEIVHSSFGEIDVRMCDDELLKISKSRRPEFLERIGV